MLELCGMTEASLNTSNPSNSLRKPGTAGRPLPVTKLRLADTEGNPMAPAIIADHVFPQFARYKYPAPAILLKHCRAARWTRCIRPNCGCGKQFRREDQPRRLAITSRLHGYDPETMITV